MTALATLGPPLPPDSPNPPGPKPPRVSLRVRMANAYIKLAVRLTPTGAALIISGFAPKWIDMTSWWIATIALAALLSQLTLRRPKTSRRRRDTTPRAAAANRTRFPRSAWRSALTGRPLAEPPQAA